MFYVYIIYKYGRIPERLPERLPGVAIEAVRRAAPVPRHAAPRYVMMNIMMDVMMNVICTYLFIYNKKLYIKYTKYTKNTEYVKCKNIQNI